MYLNVYDKHVNHSYYDYVVTWDQVKVYPLQYSGLENSMDSPWCCKESETTERVSLLPYKIMNANDA